jgi:hypothetical protein
MRKEDATCKNCSNSFVVKTLPVAVYCRKLAIAKDNGSAGFYHRSVNPEFTCADGVWWSYEDEWSPGITEVFKYKKLKRWDYAELFMKIVPREEPTA